MTKGNGGSRGPGGGAREAHLEQMHRLAQGERRAEMDRMRSAWEPQEAKLRRLQNHIVRLLEGEGFGRVHFEFDGNISFLWQDREHRVLFAPCDHEFIEIAEPEVDRAQSVEEEARMLRVCQRVTATRGCGTAMMHSGWVWFGACTCVESHEQVTARLIHRMLERLAETRWLYALGMKEEEQVRPRKA